MCLRPDLRGYHKFALEILLIKLIDLFLQLRDKFYIFFIVAMVNISKNGEVFFIRIELGISMLRHGPIF